MLPISKGNCRGKTRKETERVGKRNSVSVGYWNSYPYWNWCGSFMNVSSLSVTLQDKCYYPHPTNKETQAHRGCLPEITQLAGETSSIVLFPNPSSVYLSDTCEIWVWVEKIPFSVVNSLTFPLCLWFSNLRTFWQLLWSFKTHLRMDPIPSLLLVLIRVSPNINNT